MDVEFKGVLTLQIHPFSAASNVLFHRSFRVSSIYGSIIKWNECMDVEFNPIQVQNFERETFPILDGFFTLAIVMKTIVVLCLT